MNWTKFGKLIVKHIPDAIEFAKKFKGKSGPEKLQLSVTFAKDELKKLTNETGVKILNDPRVTAALEKANSAAADLQHVIALVEEEHGTPVPVND